MSTFLMPVLEMAAPTLEWRALAPVLLVFAAACVGILLEAVLPRAYRFLAQMTLVFATVVVSIAARIDGVAPRASITHSAV